MVFHHDSRAAHIREYGARAGKTFAVDVPETVMRLERPGVVAATSTPQEFAALTEKISCCGAKS
jgi:hypothetical protein